MLLHKNNHSDACYFKDDLQIAFPVLLFPTQTDITADYRLRKHLYGRPVSCNFMILKP